MGLFDFLRRKDERAIPTPGTPEFDATVAGSTLPDAEGVEMGTEGWTSVDTGGSGEAGDSGSGEAPMAAQETASPEQIEELKRAFFGDIEAGESGGQTLDLRGIAGLREEVLEAMQRHGLDPDPASPQQIEAASVPGLQREIGEILARHGLNIWGMGPGERDG